MINCLNIDFAASIPNELGHIPMIISDRWISDNNSSSLINAQPNRNPPMPKHFDILYTVISLVLDEVGVTLSNILANYKLCHK